MNCQTPMSRCRSDAGAVLPELALMLPFLVVLVLSVIEYGHAYSQVNIAERAAAHAARTGSSIGNGWAADYEMLRAIHASTINLTAAEIDRVVIWKANADDEVPAACKGGSGVAGLCNVYSGAQVENDSLAGFQRVGSGDAIACAGGSWDSNWCPTTRDNGRPDSDHLGVWVRLRYEGFTGLIPGDFTIERSAIYQLEPEAFTGV